MERKAHDESHCHNEAGKSKRKQENQHKNKRKQETVREKQRKQDKARKNQQ